jgi:8-hydroxy-5-deazaflavin:NADPH oxidoreductase
VKIGIIGAGNIGGTLARKLAAAGHEIKLANSRGPDSIREFAREIGVVPVTAKEAVNEVAVIILSIPFFRLPAVAGLFSNVPDEVIVIDTSNYYAFRDKESPGFEDGGIESLWVSAQMGRPVIKAWNAVLSDSLKDKGMTASSPGRIALPVAGDNLAAKKVALELMEATGFDAIDVGGLEDSWRIQPGNPAYCTDLTATQLHRALSMADRSLAPRLRDLGIEAIFSWGKYVSDDVLHLCRALTRSPMPS